MRVRDRRCALRVIHRTDGANPWMPSRGAGSGRSFGRCDGLDQSAPPQYLKDVGHAMDLIEDDEFIGVRSKVEVGLAQSGPVGIQLQLEVERRSCCADLQPERRFADLTQADTATAGDRLSRLMRRGVRRRVITLAIMEINSMIESYTLTVNHQAGTNQPSDKPESSLFPHRNGRSRHRSPGLSPAASRPSCPFRQLAPFRQSSRPVCSGNWLAV